jgi:hypothetical protein
MTIVQVLLMDTSQLSDWLDLEAKEKRDTCRDLADQANIESSMIDL